MIYKAVIPGQTKEAFDGMLQHWATKAGAAVKVVSNYLFTEGTVEVECAGERFSLPFLRDFGIKTLEVAPVTDEGDSWSELLNGPIRFHLGDIREGIVQDLIRHVLYTQGGFWSSDAILPAYEGYFYPHTKGTDWKEITAQPQLPRMSWNEVFQKLGGPVVITDLQDHWEAVNQFKADTGRTSAFQGM